MDFNNPSVNLGAKKEGKKKKKGKKKKSANADYEAPKVKKDDTIMDGAVGRVNQGDEDGWEPVVSKKREKKEDSEEGEEGIEE